MSTSPTPTPGPDRRTLLRGAGALAAVGGSAALAGCSLFDSTTTEGGGAIRSIRLGYVTPSTGPLAPFGEADTYVVEALTSFFAQNGIRTGAGVSDVEILVRDSQSDPALAAQAAAELITGGIDMMLVSSTPDTTNPVADQCEANGVPCVSTVAPWQPFFFGRGASPVSSFQWTYHFFWGLEDVEAVFMDMWDGVETNGQVGALWPNDGDGNAWGDPATGFLPVVAQRGYDIIDPGFYTNGTQDYATQIAQFKNRGTEILVGVPIPPDFPTFWNQAAQEGYRPKLATIGKALLFPSSLVALGESGNNLGTEVWWSPQHPYTSSLTGQTAQQLADAYTESTGRQWTQPIGFVHALFEVAAAALGAADSPDDREGMVAALSQLQLDTVCGRLDWNAGPVPNVAKTPLVGGQWRVAGDTAELVIVSNAQALDIPKTGNITPMA